MWHQWRLLAEVNDRAGAAADSGSGVDLRFDADAFSSGDGRAGGRAKCLARVRARRDRPTRRGAHLHAADLSFIYRRRPAAASCVADRVKMGSAASVADCDEMGGRTLMWRSSTRVDLLQSDREPDPTRG